MIHDKVGLLCPISFLWERIFEFGLAPTMHHRTMYKLRYYDLIAAEQFTLASRRSCFLFNIKFSRSEILVPSYRLSIIISDQPWRAIDLARRSSLLMWSNSECPVKSVSVIFFRLAMSCLDNSYVHFSTWSYCFVFYFFEGRDFTFLKSLQHLQLFFLISSLWLFAMSSSESSLKSNRLT